MRILYVVEDEVEVMSGRVLKLDWGGASEADTDTVARKQHKIRN